MKSKVLDRPLFKGDKSGMSEEEASNVGIMDGFMESIMAGEMDDKKPEGEDYETEKLLGRRPDSPEILMNNLRGDMRSIDARVDELADMVGMRAAQDTPQEVLALLQPVLAGQAAPPAMPPEAQGGIGGLPMGMPPTPPAAGIGPEVEPGSAVSTVPPPMGDEAPMPPEGMPPEAMGAEAPMPPEAAGGIGSLPTGQEAPPPVGMARGGYVQHFQEGGDAQSFTEGSDRESTEPNYGVYSPELIAIAEQEVRKQLAEKPATPPTLNQAMLSRIPQYKAVLGGSKDLTQAQMLFDLAGGFLNVAAGTDAEGRPIRGAPSSAMRLAAGLRNVPALVGARAAEYQKSDRDVKMMAMQAGEKDIAMAREYNYKLVDGQRKVYTEILKSGARSKDAEIKAKAALGKDPFGSGFKGKAYAFLTKNAPDYAAGKLSPEDDNKFRTSFAIINEKQYITDPLKGTTTVIAQEIPEFITSAFAQRNKLSNIKDKAPVSSSTPVSTTAPTDTTAAPVKSTTAAPVKSTTAAPAASASVVPSSTVPMAAKAAPVKARMSPTLWDLTKDITGPIPTIKDLVSNVPLLGNVGKEVTTARSTYMGEFRSLVKALQNSPVYAQGERKSIEDELDIEPRFFADPAKLRNKLIGIDNFLLGRLQDAIRGKDDENLHVRDRQDFMRTIKLIEDFRPKMGVPVRAYSIDEVNKLPSGTPFLWNGTDARVKN